MNSLKMMVDKLFVFQWPGSSADWWLCLGFLVAVYIYYEHLGFMRKKGNLSGPSMVVPFIGSLVGMLSDPASFWEMQGKLARNSTGLSWNVLLGKFCLLVRDSEMSVKVLLNARPDVFQFVGHPLGKKIFGEANLIFLAREEHKDLRRRLAPLFTQKALGVYVCIQEKTMREHIKKWLALAAVTDEPLHLRLLCRDMNLETSQNAFVGPYLTLEVREQFTKDYNLFNVGLLGVPIYLPGFAFYKATHAVKRLAKTLGNCAAQSKVRMAGGEEPQCIVDFWMSEILKEIEEAKKTGAPMPPHSSDDEIGQHMFDFLFAAQDASTSSLVWAATLIESHPEVLKTLRQELTRLRPENDAPFTPKQLRELKYVEAVVKEVLRYRPPATMVPHVASVDFQISKEYIVPKGTLVFPSLLESSFQGFPDPYKFDPNRFSPERQEDVVYKHNYLVFGIGPHRCIGQRYAINQLMIFTALFSSLLDWSRVRTPGCDDLLYTPTIAPKDGGLMRISAREITVGPSNESNA